MESVQIKKIRESLNKTQEEFATLIGVSFVTINRWESGEVKPSPIARRQLERIRKRHGIVL